MYTLYVARNKRSIKVIYQDMIFIMSVIGLSYI